MGSVAWVGLVITAIAFVLDGILWSFVFTTGMEHLVHMSTEEAKKAMGGLMARSGAAQFLFGYGFTFLWSLVRDDMPAQGIVGGLVFALLIWVPTVAYSSLANTIWYGKSRRLASATAWSSLLKYAVAGVVLSFLI